MRQQGDPPEHADVVVDPFVAPAPPGFLVAQEVRRIRGHRRYRGTQTSLARPALLSVTGPGAAARQGFGEQFVETWRVIGELEHPAIVPVYDAGLDAGVPWVLTADPGEMDLEQWLDTNGPLSPRAAAAIAGAIGGALDAAHAAGVVHGDLTAADVLVGSGDEHAWLTGFGAVEGGDAGSDIAALAAILRQATGSTFAPFDTLLDRAPPVAAHGTGAGAALGAAAAQAAGDAPAAATTAAATAPRRLVVSAAICAAAVAAVTAAALALRERPAQPPAPGPATRSFPVGGDPWGIAAAAGSVWVANNADGTVTRLDARSGRARGAPIPVGPGPTALTAGGGKIWVANSGNATVATIDPATGRAAGRPIRVRDPLQVLYAARRLWVFSRGGRLQAVNPVTRRVDARPTIIGGPVGDGSVGGLAAGAGRLWITEFSEGTVTPVDTTSGRVAGGPIRVGEGPEGVVVAAGRLWVVNGQEETVVSLDPASGAQLGRPIRTPRYPAGIEAFAGSVWVANGDDTVTRLDARTGRARGRNIPVGDDPYDFAVAAGSLWVTNNDDDTVTRITP